MIQTRRQGLKGPKYYRGGGGGGDISQSGLAGGVRQNNIRPMPARYNVARPNMVNTRYPGQKQQSGQYWQGDNDNTVDSEPPSYGGVQGTPGVDFPNYEKIPNTGFSCNGVPYEPGMYADEQTQCQAYHVCFQGRKESFLCGVGTVFNQAILACDYWHAVDCSRSRQFYSVNEELGMFIF